MSRLEDEQVPSNSTSTKNKTIELLFICGDMKLIHAILPLSCKFLMQGSMKWENETAFIDSVNAFSLPFLTALCLENRNIRIFAAEKAHFYSASLYVEKVTIDSLQELKNLLDRVKSEELVIFDSLSYLARRLPLHKLFETIRSYRSNILWVVHNDLHDEDTLKQMEYFFPNRYFMVSSEEIVVYKKKKIPETMKIIYGQTGGLKLEKLQVKEESKVTPKIDSELNPVSSFNLEMTEEQREAKNKLSLPYYEAQKSDITYVLDNGDDFDDDDPDADLEI